MYNLRIDRVGGVGGLMKMWVDSAAHDGDSWNSRFFEGHVIAAGEKSIHVEFVGEACHLSRL